MDPNDPACGPAACLRAEAEDLRQRADGLIINARRANSDQERDAIAEMASDMSMLAERYEKAAAKLDGTSFI